MLEQLIIRLKGKSWGLMLLLIAVFVCLVGAECQPTSAPEPTTVETQVVELELADVIETLVPVEVENRQPLQLDVVDTGVGRLHFRLEIDADDYPPGDDFKLEVMAIPREKMAEVCWGQKVCEEYPEVSGVTEDGRLIILVDSTEYVAANPYAFSVIGIDTFSNPVSVSISVDIPPEEKSEDHGIIIYHEYDGTIEHFSARLDEDDSGFLLATNPDDSDDPIYRCCKAHAHCSSGPACLKCGK